MKKTLMTGLALLLLGTTLNAQEIEMFDTNGQGYKVSAQNDEIKIEGMEGKVIFLEFFGLNCPGCKQAMPHLINLQDKYPQKLQVMAIEVQKNDIDPINLYKQEHGINYTTFSNFDVGYMTRYIADKSGWSGAIPFTVIIDAQGTVQLTKIGAISENTLEEYIEQYSK
jgi:thiol-disulfide isomerase/thioredoxin